MRSNAQRTMAQSIAEFRRQNPRIPHIPPQTCDQCDGSGFDYGPHTGFEKVYCTCPRGRRLAQEQRGFDERVRAEIQAARQHLFSVRFAASGIQKKHEGLTVDDLPPALRAGKESAIRVVECLRRGNGIPTDKGTFSSAVFHGPVGTGKSAMLSEIAAAWIRAGRTAMIIQWDWMIASIQNTYNNGDGNGWLAMLEDIVAADIVLIDDLGDPDNRDRRGNRPALSPDQRSKLYMIIDRRYGAGDKPVVLATNFTELDFQRLVGNRIYDRLKETALFVPVNGANLREASELRMEKA